MLKCVNEIMRLDNSVYSQNYHNFTESVQKSAHILALFENLLDQF